MSDGTWQPECWSKSPEQLVEEARALNLAAFGSACGGAHKHSDAPAPPSHMREL
jgi:hypothetical protein